MRARLNNVDISKANETFLEPTVVDMSEIDNTELNNLQIPTGNMVNLLQPNDQAQQVDQNLQKQQPSFNPTQQQHPQAPAFVSVDVFNNFQLQMMETMQQMMRSINDLKLDRAPPTFPPNINKPPPPLTTHTTVPTHTPTPPPTPTTITTHTHLPIPTHTTVTTHAPITNPIPTHTPTSTPIPTHNLLPHHLPIPTTAVASMPLFPPPITLAPTHIHVQNTRYNPDFRFQPFWKVNPVEWFNLLERRFETYDVISDEDKYFNIVKNLTPDVLVKVDNILKSLP